MKYIYYILFIAIAAALQAKPDECEENCKKAEDKCNKLAKTVPSFTRGNACMERYNRCMKGCLKKTTILKKSNLRQKTGSSHP